MKHACTCEGAHDPINPRCAMYAERDVEVDREEAPEISSLADTVEAYLATQTPEG